MWIALSWKPSLFPLRDSDIGQNKNNIKLFKLYDFFFHCCSVQFSHSVLSDSLWLHGMQHTRPPYLSPTPAAYSSSCPLSQWCHPTISFSVIPFSSRLQSFPASGYFQMSQFFASGGQSIRVSASASVLPMNIQDWFLILCESFVCNTNYRNKQWFKIILFLFLVCFILLINHLEPFPLNPTDLM